jgi:voltage-gated potassium channel Kch
VARISLVERWMSKFLSKPLSVSAAVRVIVTATAVVVVAAGVAMRLVDEKDFPNIWVGLWWAIQTVTTVGYGDVVPRTVAGRIIGAIAMLQGIAFLTIVTAAITSSFVTRAARERVFGQAHAELTDRELMEQRFDELEAKLEQLLAERG